MSSLIKDITPEELAELQATIQSPENVERLHKTFPEAMQPCMTIHPDCPDGNVDLWDECRAHPEFTDVRVLEGKPYGPLYRIDPKRYDDAKASQPEPGEKPLHESGFTPNFFGKVFRTRDGRLLFQSHSMAYARRFPDPQPDHPLKPLTEKVPS